MAARLPCVWCWNTSRRGLVEKIGDKLNIVENQAKADLERFKTFIESEGYASGAWRSSVNPGSNVQTPGIEHAERSRGDSGKAGVSGKAVAAAVGVAAAAGVGAAIRNKKDAAPEQVSQVPQVATTSTPPRTGAEVIEPGDANYPETLTGTYPEPDDVRNAHT